jgi:hypothetical protein
MFVFEMVGWVEAYSPLDANLSVEVNVVRNVERDTTVSKLADLILNDGK